MAEMPGKAPVLLYDGVCALCNGVVRLILKYDRQGTVQFAALQSPFGQAVAARHPVMQEIDSVVWLEWAAGRERIFVRSAAALRIASYLGGVWRLGLVAAIIPRPLRDWVYDQVARSRYRLFGQYESCPIPPAEVRARFLDAGL